MKLAQVKTLTEHVKLGKGLDLSSPALSIPPGALIAGQNYVVNSAGGYQRIDAYERFDGRSSPSDADYYYCEVTLSAAVAVGATILGTSSAATGVVSAVSTNTLNVTKVSGTFEAENITVGGAPVGSIDAVPTLNGASTAFEHATALHAAANIYRSDIVHPAGSGPLRGLAWLNDTLYAFRDNAGGTAGVIYKSSSSGWTEVTLKYSISFDTGVSEPSEGDTITQDVTGATAVVRRVVKESSTWLAGTATGRLIIDTIVGTFNAVNDILVGAVTKCTATSLATAITILPGGRYDTIIYNFSGSVDKKRIYGCDGVNQAFEFDGTVYVPINSGMDVDTPDHIKAHKSQLFLSFNASSQQSGINDPYAYTAIVGTLEIALGDKIVGYGALTGQALGLFARNHSKQLLGSSSDDFVLDAISNDAGAIEWSIQELGSVICVDDRGIILVTPTEAYGNFAHNTVSKKVQPAIKTIKEKITASVVYKDQNQYRLYANDGTGICMTFMDDGTVTFTEFTYPVEVSCTVSSEDASGNEVIFFGTEDGEVFETNKGSSFDGENIESYVILAFNHSGSPSVLKSYRRAVVEMEAVLYTSLNYTPDFSYSNPDISIHVTKEEATTGAGGYWDEFIWDEFFWDSSVVNQPELSIAGTGTNFSLIIHGDSAIDQGHKLDGLLLYYTPRRLKR